MLCRTDALDSRGGRSWQEACSIPAEEQLLAANRVKATSLPSNKYLAYDARAHFSKDEARWMLNGIWTARPSQPNKPRPGGDWQRVFIRCLRTQIMKVTLLQCSHARTSDMYGLRVCP